MHTVDSTHTMTTYHSYNNHEYGDGDGGGGGNVSRYLESSHTMANTSMNDIMAGLNLLKCQSLN